MANEKSNDKRILQAQGRHNLEMGILMAQNKFIDEMDALGQDDSLPEIPPEQVEELFDAMHAARDRMKAQQRRKSLQRKLAQIGVIAAAMLIAVPAVAMNVSASRTAISNYMIQNFDKYSVIQYDQEYNAAAPFGWRSEYYPRWLPEGYQIESVKFSDSVDFIIYSSKAGRDISFFVLSPYSGPQVNNEEYEEVAVMVGEHNATLYLSTDRRWAMIFIPLPDCSIQIEGELPGDTLCQIAESIKIL